MKIQDIGRRAGVATSTLRFWERELEGLIVPLRTKGGQRRYTIDHLYVIERIKSLKTKGLSLAEIRRALNRQDSLAQTGGFNAGNIENLVERIEEVVRWTIHELLIKET